MPQNGVNYKGRRGGTRHGTCRADHRVPFTGLLNGAVPHNGWPAAATENKLAGTVNGAKSTCVVNGVGNHWYKGKSTTPPMTLWKKGSGALAGGVRSAGNARGIWAKGGAGQHPAASPCNPEQTAPQLIQSATTKHQWRRTFRCNRNKAACPENAPLPLMEEDWEKETQEVALPDWEKNSYGINPYGPQDVIHYSLRGLTIQQRDAFDVPVSAGYKPAVHHPLPILWRRYKPATERDQCADADE
ncbi:uncharacterized protein [Clinocottus analis]|uniref:uncharacterized protein n=1 Tax=Clinocottus analis TaxID=304258 RepID=UPI0035BFCA2E